jgi:peptidoglycan hydrolase CwlO-like protein
MTEFAKADMDAAYMGAGAFTARLEKIAAERAKLQDALSEIQASGSAKTLKAELEQKQAALTRQLDETEALHREAAQIMADAGKEKATILQDARSQADQIRAEANADRVAAKQERSAAVADRKALAAELQAAQDQKGRASDLTASLLSARGVAENFVRRMGEAIA